MSGAYEKSCGAVVFTKSAEGIKYVIIRSLDGYYGFPKGHCETGESEEETALREIWEETGLSVRIVPGFRYVDIYPLPQKPGVMKQVVYYLAESEGQEIRYRKEELSGAYQMSFDSAMDAFRWESSKLILTKANDYLSKMEINHV